MDKQTPPAVTAATQPSNEELRKENEALKAKLEQSTQDSPAIREKMEAGLTREQAAEVVQAQRVWDEQQAKEKAAAKK